METIALTVVLVAKIISDIAFGRKALDKVDKLAEAVERRFDNHDLRLEKLEDRSTISR